MLALAPLKTVFGQLRLRNTGANDNIMVINNTVGRDKDANTRMFSWSSTKIHLLNQPTFPDKDIEVQVHRYL